MRLQQTRNRDTTAGCANHRKFFIPNRYHRYSSYSFLPSAPSSYFKRCETDDRQNYSNNVKSRYDLRLSPSEHFKMMMDRRHLENAPAFTVFFLRVLEIAYLYDYRDRFRKKYSTHNWEKKFFFYQNAQRTNRATQRERSRISHEHLRRVRIEP